MPTEGELEFVRENHFYLSNEEMGEELGVAHSTVGNWKREYLDLPRASERNRIEYEQGECICDVLDRLHNEQHMTTPEMAEELGVARRSVERWWEDCPDVPKRNQSEATNLTYERFDEDDRREQTKAAREAHFEKYGDGGHIKYWVDENPEKHREIATQAAPLGAPVREANGNNWMKGRTGEDAPLGGVTGKDHPAYGMDGWSKGITGQDHPNWRGGKSIYDAVKKQLHGPSWETLKGRHRADECYQCGATDNLHLHHIIPILSGGMNDNWNFMTLCLSCHTSVEAFTRRLSPPVLIE